MLPVCACVGEFQGLHLSSAGQEHSHADLYPLSPRLLPHSQSHVHLWCLGGYSLSQEQGGVFEE